MMRTITLLAALLSPSVVSGQSFSCRFGTQPACLDFGDKVCPSFGKCVDSNAVCFDSFQCDYEGFTCRSNLTECSDGYDELLDTHNALVDDYNDLLREAQMLESKVGDIESCVTWASNLEETKACF